MRIGSRRISPLTFFAVFIFAVLIGAFVFAGQSVSHVGVQFLDALARGDVDKLTDLSDIPGRSREEIRKEWDFAVNTAGKYYRFEWKLDEGNEISPGLGSVRCQIRRNADNPGSYDEKFELPMHKVDGKWKVAVAEVSADVFPALPR